MHLWKRIHLMNPEDKHKKQVRVSMYKAWYWKKYSVIINENVKKYYKLLYKYFRHSFLLVKHYAVIIIMNQNYFINCLGIVL